MKILFSSSKKPGILNPRMKAEENETLEMKPRVLTLGGSLINKKGFTLLEVLVTTAIIGVLFVVSSSIFINTIRSANKANITNEAKENSSLLIESLQRDVRNSTGASVNPGGDTLTISTAASVVPIIWRCNIEATANNYVSRQAAVGTELTITNRDPVNGVSVVDCSNFFTVTAGANYLLTIDFGFTQGKGVTGGSQDIQTLVSHKVSISARGH